MAECNMNRGKDKGLALTIVNLEFADKELKSLQRDGGHNKKLNPFIQRMGFDPLDSSKDVHVNQSWSKMDKLFNKAEKKVRQPEYSCLVVSICSHGKLEKGEHSIACGPIEGNDRNEYYYTTWDIMRKFEKVAHDKPIIFFIQTCRGTKTDHGVPVCIGQSSEVTAHGNSNRSSTDTSAVNSPFTGSTTNQPDSGQPSSNIDFHIPENNQASGQMQDSGYVSGTASPQEEEPSYVPMCPAGFIIAYSCVLGYKSYTDSQHGAWMLYSVGEVMDKNKDKGKISLLTLLTEANGYMAEFETRDKIGYKCIGCFQHRLTKNLVLHFKQISQDDEDEEVPI